MDVLDFTHYDDSDSRQALTHNGLIRLDLGRKMSRGEKIIFISGRETGLKTSFVKVLI